MSLKTILNSKADVEALPEGVRSLYVERDGKFALDIDDDVSGLKSALDKERGRASELDSEVKRIKKQFDGLDPEKAREALKKLSQVDEQKLIDAGKLDEVVEQRTKAMRDDYDNKINSFDRELKEAREANEKLTGQLSELLIDGAITEAAIAAGVKKSAVPDVILRGRQIYKLVDGKPTPMKGEQIIYGKNPREPMPIAEWVGTLAKEADHLFEPSSGGGATNKSSASTTQGNVVIISRETARDPLKYQQAREEARKAGKELRISEK
jgi:hypothetical protein